ncbi:hypothetical protein trd_0456 [Thermomicrobium roseum DSM 5159]|uniref:Uncharacterized protein n=1 Tax=Thermomicrobium roseum (strain ATCC 27502 / DSM 5159 / P-2) TaxID=309801 RepID=B9KYB1_THERP|nr:hypothetical protein trd_0456 [Thermomicrobium roseum DSM 5159]
MRGLAKPGSVAGSLQLHLRVSGRLDGRLFAARPLLVPRRRAASGTTEGLGRYDCPLGEIMVGYEQGAHAGKR